jgi:hypothetical protein
VLTLVVGRLSTKPVALVALTTVVVGCVVTAGFSPAGAAYATKSVPPAQTLGPTAPDGDE